MKPYRRLVINGKFLAAKPTGVHRVARQLLIELNKHSEVLDQLFPEGMSLRVPRDGKISDDIRRLKLRSHSRLIGQAWEQIELPFHARGNLLLSLCNLAPAVTRNAITMIHDAQVYTTPGSYSLPFRSWYRAVLPQIGHRGLQILTVSAYSARQLVEFGVAPAERITVVHNGVDHVLDFARDETANAAHGLTPGSYVLALASTQEHKNIDVLLRAFGQKRLGDTRLVLIGAASREDFVAKGLDVPADVLFTGKVSDEQMRVLMEQALCFAMPSLTEGFGLPPLEAMALGCPAVVAPCGALPEVCGDAALYADPHDAEAWIATIGRLRDDAGLRHAMVAAGLAQSAHFTWAASGQQLLETIRRFAAPAAM